MASPHSTQKSRFRYESLAPEQKRPSSHGLLHHLARVISWLVSSLARRPSGRRNNRTAGRRCRRRFARRNWRRQPSWAASRRRARGGDPSVRRNVFALDVGAWIVLLGKYRENGREGQSLPGSLGIIRSAFGNVKQRPPTSYPQCSDRGVRPASNQAGCLPLNHRWVFLSRGSEAWRGRRGGALHRPI